MKWVTRTLGELCTLRAGSGFKERYQGLSAGDIPFIKVSDMNLPSNRICIHDANNWVSDDIRAQLNAKPFGAGTSVFAKIGEALKQNRVRFLVRETLIDNNMMGAIPNTEIVDAKFWFYRLSDFDIAATATGTALPYLTVSSLVEVRFAIPPLSIQRRIAELLSAYDDLIENNRRRIQLLEQSARLLYKEWFVHLRFPGHEHVKITAGVPAGWKKKQLSEIAEVNRESLGGRHDGEIHYIDIASVTPNSIDETTAYHFADAPSRARRVVQHGDIIWSCVRPNRRSHAMIWKPIPATIASTGFAVISPTTLPTSYLYQALTTDNFVGYLANNARGAAYPAVTAADFEKAEIVIPSSGIIQGFDEFVVPLIDQAQILQRQNRQLAKARDLLLPRLMSGELAV